MAAKTTTPSVSNNTSATTSDAYVFALIET